MSQQKPERWTQVCSHTSEAGPAGQLRGHVSSPFPGRATVPARAARDTEIMHVPGPSWPDTRVCPESVRRWSWGLGRMPGPFLTKATCSGGGPGGAARRHQGAAPPTGPEPSRASRRKAWGPQTGQAENSHLGADAKSPLGPELGLRRGGTGVALSRGDKGQTATVLWSVTSPPRPPPVRRRGRGAARGWRPLGRDSAPGQGSVAAAR